MKTMHTQLQGFHSPKRFSDERVSADELCVHVGSRNGLSQVVLHFFDSHVQQCRFSGYGRRRLLKARQDLFRLGRFSWPAVSTIPGQMAKRDESLKKPSSTES